MTRGVVVVVRGGWQLGGRLEGGQGGVGRRGPGGGNCIKIGLPGKSILADYYQENRTSQRWVI